MKLTKKELLEMSGEELRSISVDTVMHLKNDNINCNNCTHCTRCKDCAYCLNCAYCMNCIDCSHCKNCTYCMNCSDCSYCNNCIKCTNCKKCNRCRECTDCISCSDCYKCVGQRQACWMIANIQLTEDEYKQVMTSHDKDNIPIKKNKKLKG